MLLGDLVKLAPALREQYPEEFNAFECNPIFSATLCKVIDVMNGNDVRSRIRTMLIDTIRQARPRVIVTRGSVRYCRARAGVSYRRRLRSDRAPRVAA
jgi:hypothetical protein